VNKNKDSSESFRRPTFIEFKKMYDKFLLYLIILNDSKKIINN